MAYNENWPRWMQSSVAKHYKDAATAMSWASLVEEIESRSNAFINSPQRLEIRQNGPFAKELSSNYWNFELDVHVLLTSHLGGSVGNAYDITTASGKIAAASVSIPVFKYGTGVDDDQSQIGCFTLRRGKTESIKIYHFGEIDKVNRVIQMAVDVRFELDLKL